MSKSFVVNQNIEELLSEDRSHLPIEHPVWKDKKIVICQPMLFPWVGTFEKIRISDIYVHYDDVQFSKGSFTNRVRIKTQDRDSWITVPIHLDYGEVINKVRIDNSQNWKLRHLAFLSQAYKKAKFKDDILDIVNQVYKENWEYISDLAIASMTELCSYYSLAPHAGFIRSSDIQAPGHSSERLLAIVQQLKGNVYICGYAGAHRYLDHELLERHSIHVQYIKYEKIEYPQLFGPFRAGVSMLDLVANTGPAGIDVIRSQPVAWREYQHSAN